MRRLLGLPVGVPDGVAVGVAVPFGVDVAVGVGVAPVPEHGPRSFHRAGTLGGCQLGAAEASACSAWKLCPPKETICPSVTVMLAVHGGAQLPLGVPAGV